MDVDEEQQDKSNSSESPHQPQEQQEKSHSSDSPPQPQGWSKEDKYSLLQALKCSNSSATDKIMTLLPSKSAEEIEEMVNYYKRKAAKHSQKTDSVRPARKALNKISRAPIAMWAKLLTDSFSYKELETETATALHLIAELEDIPPAACTGGVDFRSMYHTLANAIEGKSVPDDKMINALLEKCILETAYAGKAFIRKSSFRNVLNDINFSDKEINVFPRPTDNHELSTLRHLSSQRKYNPLNITEKYLKPSYRCED